MSQPDQYKYFNITFPPEHEHVAHVEINRPAKLNAFIEAMWLELSEIFTHLSTSPSVRAIVLSGAGPKAFTAGLDVHAASQGLLSPSTTNDPQDPARKATHLRRHVLSFQSCISSLERCEKPIVVAMHGFALGLAVDISVTADVRVCAADTRFAVKEVDIGLAADIGTLSRLPKVVGTFGWVKEVCLTGRIFGAEEALRVGFVSRVWEDKEAAVRGALELAGVMAGKSPVAVQGTKELLNWSRDRRVEDGLRYTAVWNSAALQTKDVEAALLSGIQKRKPTFEKL
ncbi:enoyl-CoA hydratase/isomerase family protein [Aspergillus saccharolyticus JOP 1030-1]|uniref:Enoyl-CoA hydratase/isomerase family protein n=1 Tax=Aspergillus saccharolyticus JOP 1030-1 TaxID=1450539 RepID=A0A318ZLY5_9EURO|nr:enoyl-CoA hydratase/isomerase family protein [Aspergillus saccharolyticus JOP 1030-1]PYH48546.1 enoyl-CoA hydratase/isomerase family protein [Aspergillus saccharolyticus JOP 1030-1]